jgi:hypothetical protein
MGLVAAVVGLLEFAAVGSRPPSATTVQYSHERTNTFIQYELIFLILFLTVSLLVNIKNARQNSEHQLSRLIFT